jgi:hypothetical protein
MFAIGQIVYHKLTGQKMLVLDVSNLDDTIWCRYVNQAGEYCDRYFDMTEVELSLPEQQKEKTNND